LKAVRAVSEKVFGTCNSETLATRQVQFD